MDGIHLHLKELVPQTLDDFVGAAPQRLYVLYVESYCSKLELVCK